MCGVSVVDFRGADNLFAGRINQLYAMGPLEFREISDRFCIAGLSLGA